jgi:hypothetical protein
VLDLREMRAEGFAPPLLRLAERARDLGASGLLLPSTLAQNAQLLAVLPEAVVDHVRLLDSVPVQLPTEVEGGAPGSRPKWLSDDSRSGG